MRDVASEHVANVEVLAAAYLGDRSEVEQIDVDELAARIAAGTVVLLDVRPSVEFRAGHLPSAVSVPIGDLAERIGDLPPGEVVAYCRGPYCVYALDAVRLLHEHGRAARRLDAGLAEWQRAGHAIASGC